MDKSTKIAASTNNTVRAASTTAVKTKPSTKDAGRVHVGGGMMRFKDAGRVHVGGGMMRF